MKKLTGAKRQEQADSAQLRTLHVLDLASLIATGAFEGSVDNPVEDLIDELLTTSPKRHHSLAALAQAANSCEEDGSTDLMGDFFSAEGLRGFAVQFATPVMTRVTATARTFSWGYYTSTWVYSETYEEAWALGVEWAEKLAAEAMKKPLKRRARA